MENQKREFVLAIDSSCDISIEYCKKNEVYPLFMQYTIDGKVYDDTMNEDDFKELMNFSKPINHSRDYITKEKDDYER